ncbi:MAG: adenosine deaminase [Halioglobus sp.]
MNKVFNWVKQLPTLVPLFTLTLLTPTALSASVESYFNQVRNDPPLLRKFLLGFPKGGELHTHLDGAVYAESYIRWAAEDGKCIELATHTVVLPPCDTAVNRPKVSDIQYNPDTVNEIIDAFSVRNYQRGPESGHDQFFSTFGRYLNASTGRQGSMLAEVTARAERQNTHYLETMVSYGMHEARTLIRESSNFDADKPLQELVSDRQLEDLVRRTIRFTDQVEEDWRNELGCAADLKPPGCAVEVRYLAQVIRAFPLDQVLAQTLLAFKLIQQDPRFVGLNFVAPEDAPLALRDYEAQMRIVQQVSQLIPSTPSGISLHAGELALPLVAPRELLNHIDQAVHIAGATRIGHGVDIIHENNAFELLRHMAAEKILVEINLTSNAVILEVEGDNHPFTLYREQGVPLALSTDDEGVARIDLTHEYQRATQTYDLSYSYLKELSRNALAYSFLPGDSLFASVPKGKKVRACAKQKTHRALSDHCASFLAENEKARMQWQLEKRFAEFEASY